MSDLKKENLKELLAGFMNRDAANRACDDIEKGDAILRAWPAPKPDNAVLIEIKKKVAAAVRHRQMITTRRRIFAAVAAIIIVGSAIMIRFFEIRPIKNDITSSYAAAIPGKIWESSDDDAEIAVLAAELDTIENELSELQFNNGSDADVEDLEMELIETSSDFWKG